MKFTETLLKGAYVIELEPAADERGFFARSFCEKEFKILGLHTSYPQCNISYNEKKGTLRGMHYQAAPREEVKIIRCTAGRIYDVAVDLRRKSGTYLKWYGLELTAENRKMLYVPKGMAHGFLTLTDGAEVLYMMGESYDAGSARGVRWNDPATGIAWPEKPLYLSERDKNYPDFKGAEGL